MQGQCIPAIESGLESLSLELLGNLVSLRGFRLAPIRRVVVFAHGAAMESPAFFPGTACPLLIPVVTGLVDDTGRFLESGVGSVGRLTSALGGRWIGVPHVGCEQLHIDVGPI